MLANRWIWADGASFIDKKFWLVILFTFLYVCLLFGSDFFFVFAEQFGSHIYTTLGYMYILYISPIEGKRRVGENQFCI